MNIPKLITYPIRRPQGGKRGPHAQDHRALGSVSGRVRACLHAWEERAAGWLDSQVPLRSGRADQPTRPLRAASARPRRSDLARGLGIGCRHRGGRAGGGPHRRLAPSQDCGSSPVGRDHLPGRGRRGRRSGVLAAAGPVPRRRVVLDEPPDGRLGAARHPEWHSRRAVGAARHSYRRRRSGSLAGAAGGAMPCRVFRKSSGIAADGPSRRRMGAPCRTGVAAGQRRGPGIRPPAPGSRGRPAAGGLPEPGGQARRAARPRRAGSRPACQRAPQAAICRGAAVPAWLAAQARAPAWPGAPASSTLPRTRRPRPRRSALPSRRTWPTRSARRSSALSPPRRRRALTSKSASVSRQQGPARRSAGRW